MVSQIFPAITGSMNRNISAADYIQKRFAFSIIANQMPSRKRMFGNQLFRVNKTLRYSADYLFRLIHNSFTFIATQVEYAVVIN